MNLPSLAALRAFDAASRHLSFTRAATELGVQPPAISRQVGELEASLGAALFVHMASFFAVSYFGQMILVFYLQLALVGAVIQLSQPAPAKRAAGRARGTPPRARSAWEPAGGPYRRNPAIELPRPNS